MYQADEVFHALDGVGDVREQEGCSADGFCVGLEDCLGLHDEGRETDTHERSRCKELLDYPSDDFLLALLFLFVRENDRPFLLVD